MKPIHTVAVGFSAIGFVGMAGLLGYLNSIPTQQETGTTPTSPLSEYESYQQSSDPAAVLTRHCAYEAGIPANEPQHRITPEEMHDFTSCIDRSR
jgi:hypothetical protein